MKHSIVALIALAAFIGATGCNTTDDPRQGGLFSYSPAKYEKRLQDREAKLSQIEAEQMAEEQENSALRKQVADKQKEVNTLKSQLSYEQKKVDGMLASLKKSKKANAAQVAELAEKNRQLKKQTAAANSISDNEAKKKEIIRLQKELRELEEEADALSRL